jgi:hypothetical protein
MVTLGFNKENLRNFLASSSQQKEGQTTKATPPKAKGAKPDSGGGSTSYLVEKARKDKCWRYGGPHKKKDYPNPL